MTELMNMSAEANGRVPFRKYMMMY